jgi:hypothetical protein
MKKNEPCVKLYEYTNNLPYILISKCSEPKGYFGLIFHPYTNNKQTLQYLTLTSKSRLKKLANSIIGYEIELGYAFIMPIKLKSGKYLTGIVFKMIPRKVILYEKDN